ncbi:hypothetical protein [Wenyingzhuangia sp. IMCC45574]
MNIDNIIKSRKTQKVLANEAWEVATNKEELTNTINELLDLAAAAPYHYKSDLSYQSDENELNSCLPFRCYVLDTGNCRALVQYADEQEIELKKLKNMLNAADALLVVTWLPKIQDKDLAKEEEPFPFEGSLTNMEHIAAGSAAIQNVLIGATAREIPNYWSSGGALRDKELRNYLEISMREILLGAIFLFPKDAEEREVFIKLGGLRNAGKEKNTWSKWVDKNLDF